MKTALATLFAIAAFGGMYASEQFDYNTDLIRQAEIDGGQF